MRRKTGTVIFLISALLLTIIVPAVSHADTADDTLKFADYLYTNEEYFRAISEYKRFMFISPDADSRFYAHFSIGLSYFNGKQYAAAAKAFHSISENPDWSAPEYNVLPWLFDCYYNHENFDEAAAVLGQLSVSPESAETISSGAFNFGDAASCHLMYRAGWMLMVDDEWAAASNYFMSLGTALKATEAYADSPIAAGCFSIAEEISDKKVRRHMSPLLAGVMSAVLPGLGQVYVKRAGDGLSAFLVISLWAGATWLCAANDYDPYQYITGAMALFFYAGNIYTASTSAIIWNKNKNKKVRQDLYDRWWVHYYPEKYTEYDSKKE